MKTFIGIYTATQVTDPAELAKAKAYSFNSESDLTVGDMIKSSRYSKPIQVIEILDECFEFFNVKTGDMSNELTSPDQFPIKRVEVVEVEDETIYGIIINK